MSKAEQDIQTRCHPSCRTCTNECLLLKKQQVNGVGLTELKASSTDPLIPFSCTACGLCAVVCNRRLNPGELMRAWRAEIASTESGLTAALVTSLTYQPDTLYAKYRNEYSSGVCFPEPTASDTVFFPGCALSSYTQELSLSVYENLQNRFPSIGWLDGCCFDLLDKLGLDERLEIAQQTLTARIQKRGIRQIITACPNCYYQLTQAYPQLQVISIYHLLTEEKFKISGLPARIAVHDSCADRFKQEMGSAVRTLLPEAQKLKHEGKRSICCGAGAGVNFSNPEFAHEIGRNRWMEVEASGAELLITYCTKCAIQLAGNGSGLLVVNILDLLFAYTPDYFQIGTRIANLQKNHKPKKDIYQLSMRKEAKQKGIPTNHIQRKG